MATAEEDDIEARFAAIVSPIAPDMHWDESPLDDSASDDGTSDATDAAAAREAAARDAEDREREAREIRREQRRLERAQELAEFNAEKAALEAEYNSDDDHFTPPAPPPLPRLRRITVAAVLLLAMGIALVAVPTMLVIDTQLAMVIGLILIAGGGVLLLSRLRHNDEDNDSGAVL